MTASNKMHTQVKPNRIACEPVFKAIAFDSVCAYIPLSIDRVARIRTSTEHTRIREDIRSEHHGVVQSASVFGGVPTGHQCLDGAEQSVASQCRLEFSAGRRSADQRWTVAEWRRTAGAPNVSGHVSDGQSVSLQQSHQLHCDSADRCGRPDLHLCADRHVQQHGATTTVRRQRTARLSHRDQRMPMLWL